MGTQELQSAPDKTTHVQKTQDNGYSPCQERGGITLHSRMSV